MTRRQPLENKGGFFIFMNQQGQAAVEAALIIPLLMFLIFGMLIVGSWLNAKQIVTAAAREGARVGALTGDRCAAGTAVSQIMRILDSKNTTVEIPNPLPPQGTSLVVKVMYSLPLTFDYFKSEYERSSSSSTYPFGVAQSQAAARMEIDPISLSNC